MSRCRKLNITEQSQRGARPKRTHGQKASCLPEPSQADTPPRAPWRPCPWARGSGAPRPATRSARPGRRCAAGRPSRRRRGRRLRPEAVMPAARGVRRSTQPQEASADGTGQHLTSSSAESSPSCAACPPESAVKALSALSLRYGVPTYAQAGSSHRRSTGSVNFRPLNTAISKRLDEWRTGMIGGSSSHQEEKGHPLLPPGEPAKRGRFPGRSCRD